jgi:hypothetical protein
MAWHNNMIPLSAANLVYAAAVGLIAVTGASARSVAVGSCVCVPLDDGAAGTGQLQHAAAGGHVQVGRAVRYIVAGLLAVHHAKACRSWWTCTGGVRCKVAALNVETLR